nr:immunoglobulin heavy chain junction region [Macaca mulatta]MOW23864.1 immunoglobulin heavy chain junction region [Macaca mulatta]MOW24023.1 immunoglobulin heavy chain junction region [Macaca mulatta]MOW24183.1 immunoglobulin heavy chain junction region [Macaca mulatta]MOW24392.1 immunoglobulin heavy chain junction region [Macaca mulatta]
CARWNHGSFDMW